MSEKKSSPSQEFIDSWNEYMSETPITEAELRKPTEILFREWLIHILNQLQVDTSCYNNMSVEIGPRLRFLRFKLLSTVNYFLSIPTCQKKMDLNYCNLINPTFRIVLNTLRYLLNYSFFVNMIFSNNIVDCARKVEKRDKLRTTKNQLRKDIEDVKIEEENCIKLFRDLDKRIPQQKNTIATLQEKEECLRKEVQKMEQEIEKSDMMLLEIKSRKSALTENIVSDEEAENILSSKESVECQLSEQEDFIIACRQKLKENSIAVEKIRSLTNKMESIQSEFSFDTSDIKNLRKNLVDLELNLKAVKLSITQYSTEIESLKQNIKIKNENIAKLNKRKDEFEATVGSKDKSNLQILKQQIIVLRKIAMEEDQLLTVKQRIKDEFDLIYKISTNIIKQMSTSLYFDY